MGASRGKLTIRSLGEITGFLILMSVLSRVLGYVRSIVITTQYGQTFQTDAYNAAFLIPDFIYLILIGGAFSTAFIPVLSGYITKDQEGEAWKVANTILNLVLIAVTVVIGLTFFLVPFIVEKWLGSGFTPEATALTIVLTRIMLIQSFFMCLSGISQGICHVFQQFTTPAIGSLLYNIAIILIGVWLTPTIGIRGFAIGVVVGSFLNFAIQIPTLRAIGFVYQSVIQVRHPGVAEFARLALPVILGLSVVYLNNFVTMYLGKNLGEGAITVLNNASRLIQLPIGIIATSIATSYFPILTGMVNRGAMGDFRERLTQGINLNCFLLVPASVGMMVVSAPLIRAMFRQGLFTEQNVQWTASVLVFYCIGVIGYSQQQLLNRGFYAIRDTRTAVGVNVAIILVNVALSFLLVRFMDAEGLAFAYSCAGLLSFVLLFGLLRAKVGPLGGRSILISLIKVSGASMLMGVAVWASIQWMETWLDLNNKYHQVFELGAAVVIGIIVYALAAIILRMPEVRVVLSQIQARRRRT